MKLFKLLSIACILASFSLSSNAQTVSTDNNPAYWEASQGMVIRHSIDPNPYTGTGVEIDITVNMDANNNIQSLSSALAIGSIGQMNFHWFPQSGSYYYDNADGTFTYYVYGALGYCYPIINPIRGIDSGYKPLPICVSTPYILTGTVPYPPFNR
ncbi:hypothetical protein EMN47_01920 [Prolixibacteraceae bacterium JC049]|nr:hypothetical protein [Prolixibacteraceae bacterium JC049]